MAKPRLLMIDEMSLGLAPRLVKQMFQIVHQIAESGLTILLVEQQIRRALQTASYAFVLENGATILSGETSELARHEHIKKVYLGI
jgi:branched-chain amino acid transport system ATP-binding protein